MFCIAMICGWPDKWVITDISFMNVVSYGINVSGSSDGRNILIAMLEPVSYTLLYDPFPITLAIAVLSYCVCMRGVVGLLIMVGSVSDMGIICMGR